MSHGKQTGTDRIKRQQRDAGIINLRCQGHTLDVIGQAQDPPLSPQRIHQIVRRALVDAVVEEVELMRAIEGRRLDELQAALYERGINGDVQAVACILAIMQRRARLFGLDLAPAGTTLRFDRHGDPVYEIDADGSPTIKVQVIGSPEASRKTPLRDQQTIEVGAEPQPVEETRH
jgi:hypothetical protein